MWLRPVPVNPAGSSAPYDHTPLKIFVRRARHVSRVKSQTRHCRRHLAGVTCLIFGPSDNGSPVSVCRVCGRPVRLSDSMPDRPCTVCGPDITPPPHRQQRHGRESKRRQLPLHFCLSKIVFRMNKITVVARRYLRQGNAIRQVASPSSVLQRFRLCPL